MVHVLQTQVALHQEPRGGQGALCESEPLAEPEVRIKAPLCAWSPHHLGTNSGLPAAQQCNHLVAKTTPRPHRPLCSISRTSNWGWRMQNMWVVYEAELLEDGPYRDGVEGRVLHKA